MQDGTLIEREELLAVPSLAARTWAWAITAPPVVGPSSLRAAVSVVSDDDRWMPGEFFMDGYRRMREAVHSSAQGGPPVVPSAGKKKHGLHFEDLLAQWFSHDPEIELLARDLPVEDGGSTVGQIDFLLQWRDLVYHLEVAVKFYLRFGGPQAMDGYVGSDLRDRMDRKVAHMLWHQREITLSRAGRATLLERGLPLPDRRVVSVRGLLFEPITVGDTIPRYWWAPVELWRDHPGFQDLWWTKVLPSQWMAPLREDEATWEDHRRFDARECDDGRRRPVLVAGLGEEAGARREVTRGFIAPRRF